MSHVFGDAISISKAIADRYATQIERNLYRDFVKCLQFDPMLRDMFIEALHNQSDPADSGKNNKTER